eukprot:14414762-Ditylum_brightwellii.AAC.1
MVGQTQDAEVIGEGLHTQPDAKAAHPTQSGDDGDSSCEPTSANPPAPSTGDNSKGVEAEQANSMEDEFLAGQPGSGGAEKEAD